MSWKIGDWFWFVWNGCFRSLENDGSWFGCFIINLSLCFWRSSWFSVSFLCSWQTYICFFIRYFHVISAYTENLTNTSLHHGVFHFLLILLEINTEGKNPCFSVPEICLWEPLLQISDKQSTAQFLFLLVHLLQYAPQLLQKHKTLVSYLIYQWNGCYIFQHVFFLHMVPSVFCFLTCFELIELEFSNFGTP